MRRLSAVERAIRKGSSASISLILSFTLLHDASLSVADIRFFVLFIAVRVMIDGVKVSPALGLFTRDRILMTRDQFLIAYDQFLITNEQDVAGT